MPDLGTHFVSGMWLYRHVLRSDARYAPIFYLGCILPDIVSKSGTAILGKGMWYCFLQSFHSPLSLLLQCMLISLLFSKEIRLHVFKYISLGTAAHLLFDATQIHITGGGQYFWAYPFSTWTYELPLFDVDQWPYLFTISTFMLIAFEAVKRRKNK